VRRVRFVKHRELKQSGVLVDVDGTLVDSNFHHAIAWSRALRDHGENARLTAIHRLVGMGGSEMLEELIGRDDEGIARSWRTHFDELLPEVVAFERSGELLRAFHDLGLTVALATSSPEDLLDVLRRKIDADDAIDCAVTSGDVERAKPHPDVFQVALDKTGLERDRAIVLGDSVWDVKAAERAGLRCVAVETGGFSRLELEDAGAIAVYRDPGAVIDDLQREPFTTLTR
jgi:phosphoglycolate phosphatase-like HAD superfamily hydrolase